MDWRIEHRFKDKVPNIVYYVDVFNGSLQFCPQVLGYIYVFQNNNTFSSLMLMKRLKPQNLFE